MKRALFVSTIKPASLMDAQTERGFECSHVADSTAFERALMTQSYHLVVLTKDFGTMDFRAAVALTRKWQRNVFICGSADCHATGVSMIKAGASDVLSQNFTREDVEMLNEKIDMHSIAGRRLDHYNSRLLDPTEELVGRSPAIRECIEAVQNALTQRRCVALQGEAGTGKRLLARQMHQRMLSPSAPYIMLESNPFSADEIDRVYFAVDARGTFACVKLAAGGTLVVDDVAALSEETLAKLPALVQQLAENDVRLCLITSSPMPKLKELLGADPIIVPSLRKREGDAVLIASYLLRRMISDSGKAAALLTEEAREFLHSHSWPLNILELRNWVERLAIAHECGGEMPVLTSAQPAATAAAAPADASTVSFRVGQSLEDVEKEFIRRTFEANDHVRGKTAQVLGISIRTLYTKLLVLEREQKIPVEA